MAAVMIQSPTPQADQFAVAFLGFVVGIGLTTASWEMYWVSQRNHSLVFGERGTWEFWQPIGGIPDRRLHRFFLWLLLVVVFSVWGPAWIAVHLTCLLSFVLLKGARCIVMYALRVSMGSFSMGSMWWSDDPVLMGLYASAI
jgi:hypothetical protein